MITLDELAYGFVGALDENTHYTLTRSKSDPNMFRLELIFTKQAIKPIVLLVHITDLGNDLRVLSKRGCIADLIEF